MLLVVQVDSAHSFAAVLTCNFAAQGGRYLQRNFHKILQQHIKARGGDVPAAFRSALDATNAAFRGLHPFNTGVLEGVRLAAAYIDHGQKLVHLAANEGCQAVMGHCKDDGKVQVVARVGGQLLKDGDRLGNNQRHGAEDLEGIDGNFGIHMTTVPLQQGTDTVALGSAGLWCVSIQLHLLLGDMRAS